LVMILGKVGPRNQAVCDTLTAAATHDSEPQVRLTAIDSLGLIVKSQVDSAAAPTVKTISQILEHDDLEDCRVEAAKVLATTDSCDDLRMSALVAALKDSNIDVVIASLNALSQMGTGAKAAAPDVKKVIEQNKSPEVLVPAIKALSKFGDDTIPLVSSFLSSDDQRVRRGAIESLSNYSDGAPQLLNQLLPILDTEQDMSIRWAIIRAIEKMGPNGKPAADALRKHLDKFTQDRGFVQSALRRMGEKLETQ
jgi:HEAT repeat protein